MTAPKTRRPKGLPKTGPGGGGPGRGEPPALEQIPVWGSDVAGELVAVPMAPEVGDPRSAAPAPARHSRAC